MNSSNFIHVVIIILKLKIYYHSLKKYNFAKCEKLLFFLFKLSFYKNKNEFKHFQKRKF